MLLVGERVPDTTGPFSDVFLCDNFAGGVEQVPRMLNEHKHHKKSWKRKQIGIRLPDAPVLLELLEQLDG